jgi:hypothetical protein
VRIGYGADTKTIAAVLRALKAGARSDCRHSPGGSTLANRGTPPHQLPPFSRQVSFTGNMASRCPSPRATAAKPTYVNEGCKAEKRDGDRELAAAHTHTLER